MKRLSPEENFRNSRRAWRKFLKQVQRKRMLKKRAGRRHGQKNKSPVQYIAAPENFSLTQNYNETLECLIQLKNAVLKAYEVNNRRANILIDLAPIQNLQPAAAIVLAAELDRWRRVLGIRLKPRNLREWNKDVLSFMNELGLFDLLVVDSRHLDEIEQSVSRIEKKQVALQFVTDCRNDKERTDKLADRLAERVPEFATTIDDQTDMALSTALAEASLNSVQHAYTHNNVHYPVADHRWWAAASYEDDGNVVKFFVYDQGAGIPNTLPKTPVGKEIINLFSARSSDGVSPFKSEGETIEHVLTTQISSTGDKNRGKGFPQIVAAASARGGRLRVLSGKGSAIYEGAGSTRALTDNQHHLGGTLLEWTFRLDEM
jgi:hypothetical protein